MLPFLATGQLFGVSTGKKHVLWPPLIEKAVSGHGYIYPQLMLTSTDGST